MKFVFEWFESRIDPYPEGVPQTPNSGLLRFIWSNMAGVRGWVAALAVLTAGVGVMEALMFQFMGKIVDWLSTYSPHMLRQEKGSALTGMAVLLLFFIVWTFLPAMCAFRPFRAYFRCACAGIFTV